MSNIYLKVSIETFSKRWFFGLKKFVTRSVFGELQLTQRSLNFKTSFCNLKSEVWEQNYMRLFYYFNFERNYDVSKSKSPCILLKKNINFNKSETNHKLKESQIKSKIVMSERKKRVFFVTFILPEENFLTFVLFQCTLSTECTFRIYILLHIKKHFMHFFCLFLKSSKAFSVSLNYFN